MTLDNNPTRTAEHIIRTAIAAVDPFSATKAHLHRTGNALTCGEFAFNLADFDRVLVIGFGKAGAPMAQAVHSLLHDKISAGLVLVKYKHTPSAANTLSPIKIVEAAHPVPDAQGVAHTRALINLLKNTTPRDLVLCLISGGGSALLTAPVPGVTLAELQTLNRVLLRGGAPITAINAVRKHVSQVKGGRLAELAAPATMLNLILSDVGGDPLDVIASGPTAPDSTTFADAVFVLKEYGVWETLPPALAGHFSQGLAGTLPDTPKAENPIFARVHHQIIGNNQMALEAAARAAAEAGFSVTVHSVFVEDDVRAVADWLAEQTRALRRQVESSKKKAAFLFGGEPTVVVRGDGLGGRNTELALATAQRIAGVPHVLAASVGTDGTDGPTDAAGALVSGETAENAATRGLDVADFLRRNDSYHFFEQAGGLIKLGATGTNVNDIGLVLAW